MCNNDVEMHNIVLLIPLYHSDQSVKVPLEGLRAMKQLCTYIGFYKNNSFGEKKKNFE